jgi:hypothetical protein
MSTYYKYRFFCETEQKFVFIILNKDDPLPTKCPNNTNDIVSNDSIVVVETISENTVVVKEGNGTTGGTFGVHVCSLNIEPNTTNTINISFPYPISALNTSYVTTTDNIKDILSVSIGENTPIGVLTFNLTPATSWTNKNYNSGQTVTYTHFIFGLRTYTCINNTINNEIPTNIQYWKHGLELYVSPTVIQYVSTGYYIKLFDGTNTNDVGRVISVDKVKNCIYVENNTTYNFNIGSVILQTIYLIKDAIIGNPNNYLIGGKKIGGTYIPEDTIIKIYYSNLSSTDPKFFNGTLEYVY